MFVAVESSVWWSQEPLLTLFLYPGHLYCCTTHHLRAFGSYQWSKPRIPAKPRDRTALNVPLSVPSAKAHVERATWLSQVQAFTLLMPVHWFPSPGPALELVFLTINKTPVGFKKSRSGWKMCRNLISGKRDLYSIPPIRSNSAKCEN